jgi:hypothetical protein
MTMSCLLEIGAAINVALLISGRKELALNAPLLDEGKHLAVADVTSGSVGARRQDLFQ